MLPGFTDHVAALEGGHIAYSRAGQGAPLLLLHGFPQNRAMWHGIAPALAQHFEVIAADLRGYGASFVPENTAEAMSFRAMAADQVALMRSLGFEQFHVVGHDRGARTAHRMALDAPEALLSLTVADIVPTHTLLSDLDPFVAKSYYHWFFLAQPSPFPETFIGFDPDRYFESCLSGWGKAGLDAFDADALAAYRAAWRQPERIAAMCNDYRAGIDVDFHLDAEDLTQRVTCPALVLYGADGIMAEAYDVAATWAPKLTDMTHRALPGGHFLPDTHPAETTAALLKFLNGL
ncbi:MAG: alpha/beta hydrolase [Rhodobacteraceae bacterium]|nr:alpha/beta hydrolase [Paracoccaceae bacterium]